jgi:hypothetical protein
VSETDRRESDSKTFSDYEQFESCQVHNPDVFFWADSVSKSFGDNQRPLMRFGWRDMRTTAFAAKTTTELRIGVTRYCSGGVS